MFKKLIQNFKCWFNDDHDWELIEDVFGKAEEHKEIAKVADDFMTFGYVRYCHFKCRNCGEEKKFYRWGMYAPTGSLNIFFDKEDWSLYK